MLFAEPEGESSAYLTEQIITCLGNKRALLGHILRSVQYVKECLGKDKISCLDLFSGSGIVSRALKAHATDLFSNDLEPYARVISECYLANPSDVENSRLHTLYNELETRIDEELSPGSSRACTRHRMTTTSGVVSASFTRIATPCTWTRREGLLRRSCRDV